MSHSIIASQLDAQANQYLRDHLPDHQVIDIEPGQLALKDPADVFILRPINVRGHRIDNPPPGWPWDLKWGPWPTWSTPRAATDYRSTP